MAKILTCLLFLTTVTSCYHMPTEDDYCLIPATNNKDYTRESNKGAPGVGY